MLSQECIILGALMRVETRKSMINLDWVFNLDVFIDILECKKI